MSRLQILLLAGIFVALCYELWPERRALIDRLSSDLPHKVVEARIGVISAGEAQIVALRGDSALWGWGFNGSKELGLAGVRSLPVPRPLTGDRAWRYVFMGNTAFYAIDPLGKLWRRGFVRSDRASDPLFKTRVDLQPLFPGSRWRKVLESQGRTVGLDESGQLWNWDERSLEDRYAADLPARIEPEREWVDFCVDRVMDGLEGPGTIYAVSADGSLWKSGLASGSGEVPRFLLSAVDVPPHVERVFCRENGNRLLALDDDKQLWGFGANSFGELGDGDDSVYTPNKPVPPEGFRKLNGKRWIEMALGLGFTIGITDDGALWAWGRNMDGELGIDDETSSHDVPTLVDDEHTWLAATAGHGFAAAVTSQGELYTWGRGGDHLGEGGLASVRNAPGLTQERGGWVIGPQELAHEDQ